MNSTSSNFKTVSNNGKIMHYTNACMWIGIRDGLRHLKHFDTLTVKDLRSMTGFTGGDNDVYDHSVHSKCLEHLADYLDIQIIIRYVNYNKKTSSYYLGSFSFTMGNSSKVITIAAFGNHFEFVINSGSDYVPKAINTKTKLYEPILHMTKYELYYQNMINEYDSYRVIHDMLRSRKLQTLDDAVLIRDHDNRKMGEVINQAESIHIDIVKNARKCSNLERTIQEYQSFIDFLQNVSNLDIPAHEKDSHLKDIHANLDRLYSKFNEITI